MAGIGSATGLLVGVGVGGAASQALEPDFVDIKQNSWKDNPNLVLEADVLAQLVAQGAVELGAAAEQATYSGLNEGRFADLVFLEQRVPGAAELLFLWRYGKITEDDFRRAMTKAAMRPEFIDAMVETFSLPLEPGAIATAVHRGIMDGTGLILQEPPTTPGVIPIVPPSSLDPVAQAQALGISHEQLRILVGNTGLPLSLGEMNQLLNRGIVTEDDVKRAVAESNLRNEYMDVAVQLRRRLLTPHEYAEAELRGVKQTADAKAGAALSGLEGDDYETLFAILGRPLSVHQLTTGLARGGTFGGTYDDVPEPYRDAIRRSAIRPEYAVLDYTNRYTYPSAFVMRSLAQAGEIGDAAAVAQLLEEIGWKPELAAKVAAKWVPAGTGGDPHTAKAQTQLWTTTHRSYVAAEIGNADAQTALAAAGVSPSGIPQVIALWQAERALVRKQLSVSEITKAVKNSVVNPATGSAWTQQDAITALVERGYSQADAQTIVAEA